MGAVKSWESGIRHVSFGIDLPCRGQYGCDRGLKRLCGPGITIETSECAAAPIEHTGSSKACLPTQNFCQTSSLNISF